MRNSAKGHVIFATIFFIVALIKYPTLGIDYHWDATLYAKQAVFFLEHGPLAVSGERIFHVPLLLWISAFFYRFLGESVFVSHMIIAAFSSIGVYYSYKSGKGIAGETAGKLCALFVFVLPAYFALSGQFLFDIPVAAATLATAYHFSRGDMRGYLTFAVAAGLLKESGVLVAMAAVFYSALKERNSIFVYAIPIVPPIMWQLIAARNGAPVGNFISKVLISQMPQRFVAAVYDTVWINNTWVFLFLAIVFYPKVRQLLGGRNAIYPITVFVYIVFFSISPVAILPRYFIPATALFVVAATAGMASSIEGAKLPKIAFTITILLLSAYSFHSGIKGLIEDPLYRGIYENKITALKNGEMTMDYVSFVRAEEEAVEFILKNYKGKTVAAGFPIYEPDVVEIDVGKRKWLENRIRVVKPDDFNDADILVFESCCPIVRRPEWPVIASFGGQLNTVNIYQNPAR